MSIDRTKCGGWPGAIRWDLVDAIATRIKSSVNPSYRRQCLSALAGLRLPVEILSSLDREAKRLLSGDASATQFICELLEPIASHAPRPSWATHEGQTRVRQAVAALTYGPAGFQRFPADGVVNPVAMLLIDRAVEYSAGPEPSRRMAYAFALDWLWRESARLDAL